MKFCVPRSLLLPLFPLTAALLVPVVFASCDDAETPAGAVSSGVGQAGTSAAGSNGGGDLGGAGGGPVAGPVDTHCGDKKQATSQAACHSATGVQPTSFSFTNHPGLQPLHEDGMGGAGGTGHAHSEYGDTLYNSVGEEDDCKYHVAYTVSPIRQNQDVSFTVTVTSRVDNSPVVGAAPRTEVYLNETHPAPNVADNPPAELSPGVYTIGPVKFDASGDWTVRFHFFETCDDLSEESPHGHVAFFVHVP